MAIDYNPNKTEDNWMSQSPDLLQALSNLNRRRFMQRLAQYGTLAAGSGVLAACANQTTQTAPAASSTASPAASPSGELKKITYGTNWYASTKTMV
jgi:NitT/TauT family transport system substrate-binding protein